jgi:hypothetical protein
MIDQLYVRFTLSESPDEVLPGIPADPHYAFKQDLSRDFEGGRWHVWGGANGHVWHGYAESSVGAVLDWLTARCALNEQHEYIDSAADGSV